MARLVRRSTFTLLLLCLPLALGQGSILGLGLSQINLALIAIMAAVALNLLVGYTGLISLGHAAFFAVGAMTAGILGTQLGVPFPVVLMAGTLTGALVGTVVGLPSLRLRGLFLMLATLALHFIALFIFTRYMLANFGPSGVFYAAPSIAGLEIGTDEYWYFVLLAFAVGAVVVARNLVRSRYGRALVAVRDHDIAAASLGINVTRTRLVAFAVSSSLVTVAGVLYAYYLGLMTNETFTLPFVVGYFAMIIIGGMSSIGGAVVGAIAWQFLPQVVETLSIELAGASPALSDAVAKYQGQIVSIILGLLIVLILRYRPGGLVGLWAGARSAVRNWPYSN